MVIDNKDSLNSKDIIIRLSVVSGGSDILVLSWSSFCVANLSPVSLGRADLKFGYTRAHLLWQYVYGFWKNQKILQVFSNIYLCVILVQGKFPLANLKGSTILSSHLIRAVRNTVSLGFLPGPLRFMKFFGSTIPTGGNFWSIFGQISFGILESWIRLRLSL